MLIQRTPLFEVSYVYEYAMERGSIGYIYSISNKLFKIGIMPLLLLEYIVRG